MARTALDVYVGIRRREPAYIAMGVAGMAQTAAEWSEDSTNFDLDRELRARGLAPLWGQTQYIRFFYHTLRRMGVHCTTLQFGKQRKANERPNDYKVECYPVGNTQLYFAFNGSFLDYIWGTSKELALAQFSLLVRQQLGQYVLLNVLQENWTTYMTLGPLEPHLEAYVSPIDLADWCHTVRQFEAKGLNRAHILYGPPGTGKTTWASLVAQELQGRLLVIEAASLNKIMDAGVQLDTLIDIVQPKILLLDDLDRTRSPEELFGEVERINRTRRNDNLLLLCSINDIEALPVPLRRTGRFDEVVEFTLPDAAMRHRVLSSHLADQGIRVANGYVGDLVEVSAGLSCSDLRELALQISVRGYEAAWIKQRVAHMLKFRQATKEEASPGTTPSSVSTTPT